MALSWMVRDISEMRRPTWLRTLLLVWSVWFAVILVDGAGMRTCPTHGGSMSDASGAMSMAEHQHSSNQSSNDKKDVCRCLGACCLATQFVLPGIRIATPAAVVADQRVVAFTERETPIVDPPFVHPFANGPPA